MARDPKPPASRPIRVDAHDSVQRALDGLHRRIGDLEVRTDLSGSVVSSISSLSGTIGSSIDSTDADVSSVSSSLAALSASVSSMGGRLLGIQKFTTNGSYVPTSGTLALRITLVGSGGAGGAGTTTTGAAGGGGSSAEWAVIYYDPGFHPSGSSVTIGAAPSSAAGNPTSLNVDGITFTAVGGNVGNTTTSVSSYAESDAVSLGTAGSTDYDLYRGSNASVEAMPTSTTVIAGYTAGLGGGTPYGAGGRGSGGDAAGAPGAGYGAGGGGGRRGAASNRSGGDGAPGLCMIEEYGK